MQLNTIVLCVLLGGMIKTVGAEPVINNIITLNPIIHASPVLSAQQFSTTQIDLYQAFLKTVYCKAKEYSQSLPLEILERAKKNWAFILGGSCVVGYVALLMFMLYEHKKLKDFGSWAHWSRTVSCLKLENYSIEQIEQELVLEIQKRYFNPNDPTNCISPLILFWNDLEREIWTLEWYLVLWRLCRHKPFVWFLPINKSFKNSAKMALQRAYIVKKLFLTWIAERNATLQSAYIQKAS